MLAEHPAYCEQDAARILRQVLLAAAHMHELGVAHLDIKPENILMMSR